MYYSMWRITPSVFLHAVKDEIKPTSDEPTSDTVEAGSTDEAVTTVVNTEYQSVEGQNIVHQIRMIRRGVSYKAVI